MINKENAAAIAYLAIADLVGKDYFRSHFKGSCHAYPCFDDDVDYEHFLAFVCCPEKMTIITIRSPIMSIFPKKILLLSQRLKN